MEFLVGLLVFSPFSAVILGFVAIYLIAKKRLNIKLNYWSIGLLLLSIWSIIVGIINKSIYSALASILILVYFFVSQFSSSILYKKDFLYKTLDKLALFTAISAAIGIIEKMIFIITGDSGHRIYSTFGNPNMTGSWFCSILFVIWFLSKKENNYSKNKQYITYAALTMTSLLLTGSRGAYISLAFTTLVFIIFKGFSTNKRTMLSLMIISSIMIGISVFAKSDLILDYIVAHPFKDSINPRIKIWLDAINLIKTKPITGWGLLASYELGGSIMINYNKPSIHAHNLWLSIFSSLGIIGLIIYLYMKIKLFKNICILYKNNKNLGLLCLSINLIVIVHGLVDMSLFAPQLGILFSITGALTNDLAKEKSIIITPNRIKQQITILSKAFNNSNAA